MGWFILACLCGGGLFGMSRAQLNRNQERRNSELIDATYDAAGSYDNDGGGCDYDSGSYDSGGDRE
jgi:hypothetical protein